jgi:XTP/dITP diphosphohydrolase
MQIPITLLFASNNLHKAAEINNITGLTYKIITLREAGIEIDIQEPHPNFHDNALEKSRTIYQLTKKNCFSEDSGLEVKVLGGAPGVRSARYAHDKATDQENIDKLLDTLKEFADRTACFRTVISLQFDGGEYFFEGECNGQILLQKRGSAGFGYDPIFVPDGSTLSFAEMSSAEKNQFSHREKAVRKMLSFLQSK